MEIKMSFAAAIRIFGTALVAITAASTGANAEETVIRLTLKDHRFQPAEPHAPAGQPLTVIVKNLDATPAEFESKTLRVEKVVTPGGEISMQIRPLNAGRYRFADDFNEAAAGTLIVE
jgi:hypothetical protein